MIQNEPSPLHPSTIVSRCTQKIVNDFTMVRCQVGVPQQRSVSFFVSCRKGLTTKDLVHKQNKNEPILCLCGEKGCRLNNSEKAQLMEVVKSQSVRLTMIDEAKINAKQKAKHLWDLYGDHVARLLSLWRCFWTF